MNNKKLAKSLIEKEVTLPIKMEDGDTKIFDVVWFSPGTGTPGLIGVVLAQFDDGEGTRAFIGTAMGHDEKIDAFHVAHYGAKFPMAAAKALFGIH